MVRLFTTTAESGGVTDWTGVTGAFTATIEQANQGTNGYKSDLGNPAAGAHALKTFTGAVGTTYYARTYLRVAVSPAGLTFVFRFRTATPGLLVGVLMTASRTVILRNDQTSGTIGSASAALALDTWHLIEASLQINASTGDDVAELKVNGVSVSSSSVLDLGATAPGRFEVGQISTAGGVSYVEFHDDLAINDSTGATDNTWVGAIVTGQFARPTADVTDGTWTDQAGGVSLFAAIGETTASDADYIQSASATTTADVSEIALGTITDPAVSTGHIIRYRYGKDVAAGDVVNLTVSLRQGTATEIAVWTHTDISDVPTTVAQTLTAAQADAVTDYSALRLRFSSIKV